MRTLARPWGWDFGAGADVTFYSVPDSLRPYYGDSPVSFHVFFRIRPPAPMGRMMDMTMTIGSSVAVVSRRLSILLSIPATTRGTPSDPRVSVPPVDSTRHDFERGIFLQA